MARNYQSDRKLADHYLIQIQQILGPYVINIASFECDARQATDLVLIKNDITIACRVRTPGYARIYGKEFTIRAQRDIGTETELSKIRKGWAKWLFYCHLAGPCETEADKFKQFIAAWFLLDLNTFRQQLAAYPHLANPAIKPNGDGTWFAPFRFDAFPSTLIIAQYWDDTAIAATPLPKSGQYKPKSYAESLEMARKVDFSYQATPVS